MATKKENQITVEKAQNYVGTAGSDAFHLKQNPLAGTTIDGGTETGKTSDATVEYKGSTLTSKITYSQQDILYIDKSLDLSALNFTHIEKLQLAEGVNLVMTSEQFENAQNSLGMTVDDGNTTAVQVNPGLLISGTKGGKPEKITINVAKDSDFQLDDASTGHLFKDVEITVKFAGGNTRYDGTAASEIIRGGDGTDYVTPRLGDDTVYGGAGNDLLTGHEGADKLYGEEGDDIFMIGRLATKANGGGFTVGKASDGSAELVNGDVMDGGNGIDELRIAATGLNVSPIENTVTLTPENFINIEKVTIGTNAPRDKAKFDSVQKQMAAGELTAVPSGKDAINVNGATLKKAVIFTGNDGQNMLIGGAGNDEFHGNSGNDIFVGGAGTDKFFFETPLDAINNVKTIFDFTSGTDKLVLNHAVFSGLSAGALNNDLLITVDVTLTASMPTFIFDTKTGNLSFDVDGSGTGTSVQIAQLTGVSSLSATDFMII